MRLHTLLLVIALIAGTAALFGVPAHATGAATVTFFICMNLAAISLATGPYGSGRQDGLHEDRRRELQDAVRPAE